jgi:hypothetical protein
MRARSWARASLAFALQLQPRARAAQQIAQPAFQQAPLRRLDEEVRRAGLVGAVDGGFVVQAGQHQHRQRLEAGRGAQQRAGLEAVELGHQRVQHDDVGRARGQVGEGVAAAVGFGDVEAALAQRGGGQQQIDFIVVHQQHARRVRQVVEGLTGWQHEAGFRAARPAPRVPVECLGA